MTAHKEIDSPQVIAKRIQEAMAFRKAKQKDLSEDTGFSKVYINQIVNGKREFYTTDGHLRRIATALDINPQWLIYGSGTMTAPIYGDSGTSMAVDFDAMKVVPFCKIVPNMEDSGFQILEDGQCFILPKFITGTIAKAFAIKVDSEMLAPALCSGDFAIISADDTHISDGRLYAIWFMNRVHFRYITVNLSGVYTLSTSADGHRAEMLSEQDSKRMVVIGCVVAKVGSTK